MPSKSEKQREAMAIAEHDPKKLYKRNKGILKMSKKSIHEFASTKGIANKKKKSKIDGFDYSSGVTIKNR